jgi:hypothetical protein
MYQKTISPTFTARWRWCLDVLEGLQEHGVRIGEILQQTQ